MSHSSAARVWVVTPFSVAGSIVRLFLWYTPVTVALMYAPPSVTVAVAMMTVVCLVLWYTRRWEPRSTALRFATLRLRRIGTAAPWVAGMAVAMPLGVFSVTFLLLRWGYPLDQTPNLLDPYLRRPGGLWAVAAFAVLVAPVLEEFTFRGWIQRPLERLLGAPSAIAISAALFALAHGEPLRLPILFLDGLVLGSIVYLTRSIWAGVAVHAANNSLAVLSAVPPVQAVLAPLRLPNVWVSLSGVCVAAMLLTFLFRGLWRATRRTGAPSSHLASAVRLAPGSIPP